jgi:hypothetical protein
MPGVDASAVPAPEKFPHGSGFWAVALAAFSAMGLFAGLSGLFPHHQRFNGRSRAGGGVTSELARLRCW